MYGKNGRGKSSVSQALLLIAQSIRKANELNELVINGELVSLGYFEELLYNSKGGVFTIGINSETENLLAQFEGVEGHAFSGRLSRLSVMVWSDLIRFLEPMVWVKMIISFQVSLLHQI